MDSKSIQRSYNGVDNGKALKRSSKRRRSSRMKTIVAKLSVSGPTPAADKEYLLQSDPSSPERLGLPTFRRLVSHSDNVINGSLSSVSTSSVPTTIPRNSSF